MKEEYEEELLDISEQASNDEVASIIAYINRYFSNSDNSKIVYNDFVRLSSFIKRNNITVGEIESDKLLKNDIIKNGLGILYRADILVRLSNFYNLNSLVELYCLRNNFSMGKDADIGLVYDTYGRKDLDLFKLYLNEISEFSILGEDEEKELFNKARNGDIKAREKFLNHNLRLVVSIAKNNASYGLSLTDLIQYGNEGLLCAYKKYNPDLGYKFSTYAYWWIKQYIYRGIADASRIIRVPVYIHDYIIIIRRVISEYALENDGRIPSLSYICSITGINMEHVKLSLKYLESVLSLNAIMSNGDDSAECESSFVDFIEDVKSADMFDAIDTKEYVDRIIDGTYLTDREKFVIEARYGFKDREYTLAEIGKLYGITREWVRQIELRALKKLHYTACNPYFNYKTNVRKLR